MKHTFRSVLASCVVLLFGYCVSGATTVPVLRSHINDYANKLDHTGENDLEQILSAFEQETSNQVVVLVTPSLDGESIESYSQNVFHAWALGQKEKNNGVLLVWAPTERKVRIHVGYGLEGVLTDALASQIIRNELAPQLKSGKTDFMAIKSGVAKITQAIKGEYTVEQNSSPHAQISGLGILLFVVAVIAILSAGSIGGPVIGGIIGVAVGFLFGNWVDMVVLSTVLGFLLGLISRFMFQALDSGSSGSSSWSSSSSDSGSSWGGGGGDSGGGGASGDY